VGRARAKRAEQGENGRGVSDAGRQPTHCDPMIKYSVVICTRNPRDTVIKRVLESIQWQSFKQGRRELVIVDSGSTPPLVQRDWQLPPGTRIVRVDEPGVGRARVAGARAASGEWIVFVDDDNVLDADYLTEAEGVIARHPDIALFCGRISAEFEEPPPPWVLRFKRQLAIIDFDEDSWARYWDPAKIPCWTAGMCIRSDIMNMYCDEIQKDAFATALTRVEDVYLVMRTVAKGHLAGLFRGLHLRHLIPKNRMTQEYLCGIVYETGYNVTVLRCRASGAGIKDLLRPLKQMCMTMLRHGLSPIARVECSAALGDLCGALACLGPRFRKDVTDAASG
jgi:hypothetical protein